MKYLFASDIHGSASACRNLLHVFDSSGAEQLILLGDLLYHGPRNDLPDAYAPKEVIAALNNYKNKICAVRGNCEAEVDQMVLEFPCMADYALLLLNGVRFYATHGHIFNPGHLPPLMAGDALVFGHTHLPLAEKRDGIYLLNPGSVAIPKGGNPPSYALLGENRFRILDFAGKELKNIAIN